MTRAADSTIKGFLYQFNKTLIEILEADEDDVITVEGLVEDLDIQQADGGVKAIQCKYHESRENFTTSLIYKPILQMAEAFSYSPSKRIEYVIFVHVPNEEASTRNLCESEIEAALGTSDKSLRKIVDRISDGFELKKFQGVVTLQFGCSIDDLEVMVKKSLGQCDFEGLDVETLLYPNAITKISKMSSMENVDDRKLSKLDMLDFLSNATVTTISKWTLALKNRSQLLLKNKNQLAHSLGQNTRDRCFYFDESEISDFEDNIVIFISNYLAKYNSKPAHLKTPIFVINKGFDEIKNIEHRLFKKGIRANTGLVGGIFEVEQLYREPIKKFENGAILEREFDLRLLACKEDISAMNFKKGDDLFIVSSSIPESIDMSDIDIYQVGVADFKQLEYITNIRKSYE